MNKCDNDPIGRFLEGMYYEAPFFSRREAVWLFLSNAWDATFGRLFQ